MEYTLKRSKRRTVALQIKNGLLFVSAPYLIPKIFIENFIKSKKNWIEKKIIEQVEIKKLSLKEDELMVFGKIIKKKLELKERNLYFLEKTTDYINEFLKGYLNEFSFKKDIKVRYYKSKWGSCSADNKLSFNSSLVMAPPEVIDYVILHELCHTRVKNHSKRFWKELEKYCPDYKKCRKWLRDNRILIY